MKALLKSCVCVCVCVCVLTHVWLFAAPWTLAHQAPLSMEFSRKEYWNGLPLPTSGDLPNPGIKPKSPMSIPLAGRFFTTNTIWEGSLNSQQLFKCIVPTNKHKKSYCLYEGWVQEYFEFVKRIFENGKEGDHLSHMFKSEWLRMAFKGLQHQAFKEAIV